MSKPTNEEAVDVMAGVLEEEGPRGPKGPRGPNGPRRSFFTDEPGDGHHLVVEIDGYKIYARELGQDHLDELAEADKAFETEGVRIQKAASPGKAPNTGKLIPPKIGLKEAQNLERESYAAHRKAYAEILKKVVVDWDLPSHDGSKRECTAEAIAALPKQVVLDIIKRIVQKTVLGTDEGDFLSAS